MKHDYWKVLSALSFIKIKLIVEPEPVEIYKIVRMHAELYHSPLASFLKHHTLISNGPLTFCFWLNCKQRNRILRGSLGNPFFPPSYVALNYMLHPTGAVLSL